MKSARPQDQSHQIAQQLQEIASIADPAARELAEECIRSVLALHGEGLAQILRLVRTAPNSQKAYESLLRDRLVCALLLVHGLHPLDLKTRLLQALEKVRPYMESHGGNVELLSLEEDFARLRLQGTCKTCPSSAVTLELAVRQAVEEACPDLAGFEVEGTVTPEPQKPSLTQTQTPEWVDIEPGQELKKGALLSLRVSGVALLLCNVNDKLYAYRDRCSNCNTPLHLGVLQEGVLKCGLGHSFDVQQAGRSTDSPSGHLKPVPLLVENGIVKVMPGAVTL